MRMRTIASLNSGAVRARTLAVIVLLVAVFGLAIVFLNRPKTWRAEVPIAPEMSRTNLVLEMGRLRQQGSTNPFSGLMVEHYADGTLRSRSAVSNGVLHGLSQGWYTNGQIQVSEQFKEGVSDGVRTKWYPGGAKQSEASIAAGKLNGTFRRWHENGAVSEQAEFVADKPEGVSVSYFPSGYLKARVVMKDGKAVEQNSWKDGEKKE
jgi:antitoxin component YwqK of YwqJK toxin-antitoxin module